MILQSLKVKIHKVLMHEKIKTKEKAAYIDREAMGLCQIFIRKETMKIPS